MAEDKDNSQEKTQDPTQRRLDKAREEGKVLSSKEIFVFTSLFAGILLFYITKFFIEDFLEIFKSLFVFGKELNSGKKLIFSFSEVIKLILKVFLVFAIPLLIVSIVTQFLVGGINFSLQAIYWKFEKINPIKGFKRIFSMKGLVELIKALLKVILLGSISYYVIFHYLPDLVNITSANLFSAANRISSFYPIIAIALLVVLAFIGIIDLIWQRYDFMKSLRMSHQDIKDEYKETDGQPEVKQKIRKLQAEAANKSRKENAAIDNLGEATAIITNPTHFAVALKYEVGEASAPVVICKGKGKIAEKIIEKGKKLNIGTMQSPKLARAIYFTSEIGDEIMNQLYSAVAMALAYIFKVDKGEDVEEPEIELPSELVFDEFGRNDVK